MIALSLPSIGFCAQSQVEHGSRKRNPMRHPHRFLNDVLIAAYRRAGAVTLKSSFSTAL
jgi:hypothetical protein